MISSVQTLGHLTQEIIEKTDSSDISSNKVVSVQKCHDTLKLWLLIKIIIIQIPQ